MAVRDPGAGTLARTAARHCLRTWAVGEATLGAALQVIAELVANVYEHTGSELAVLIIWHLRDCVRIEVSDFGEPKLEGTFPLLSVAGDGDEGRRGLTLVNSFASRWGSRPNGKRGLVRFAEIPIWT
jgi:anti-sigma regulatory factor (Ser/Thr protein kinase)